MNQLLLSQRIVACVLFLLFAVEFRECAGFAGTGLPVKNTVSRRQRSKLYMYVPKQASSQAAPASKELPKVAQQMIPNPTSIGPTLRGTDQQFKKAKHEKSQRQYSTELSNSVLHECNTLPSFPTAHGILSPETVMRMEEMIEFEGRSSEAVERFLRQYRRHGPMSCLSMLSDPEVLPHLTKAMRDVV